MGNYALSFWWTMHHEECRLFWWPHPSLSLKLGLLASFASFWALVAGVVTYENVELPADNSDRMAKIPPPRNLPFEPWVESD